MPKIREVTTTYLLVGQGTRRILCGAEPSGEDGSRLLRPAMMLRWTIGALILLDGTAAMEWTSLPAMPVALTSASSRHARAYRRYACVHGP